jgi:hypothetical protein
MVDQHSALWVKLSDLIEGMDFQSDERSSFLNLTTGEVVSIADEELRAAENDAPLEDFPDWQHDVIRIARDIVETDHYLPLPDRFEITEYRIMEQFCLSVDDDDLGDRASAFGITQYFPDASMSLQAKTRQTTRFTSYPGRDLPVFLAVIQRSIPCASD